MGEASILLVDDEHIIRKCLTKELKAEHFSVTEVANGVDAIRAIQDFHFNLVITDLMMEGIDGFGVLKAVKELAPLTRVMVITGYGDIRTAIEALHLGADDFLVKPFEMEEFLFRIRRCLEKRSLIEMLMEKTNQLEKEITRRRLGESDTAIRVALKKCDEDRKNSFDRVLANIPGWVESLLDQMEDCQSPEQRQVFANELRARISRLIFPGGNMSRDNGD